jgi:pectate lyase
MKQRLARGCARTLAPLVGGFLACCVAASTAATPADAALAFPGAQGWAAHTPGGRGGRIIRVTTLANAGPGSLRAAVAAKGARIIVFEVGGAIDLDRQTLDIAEPFVTIAGQTAPSPGISLIRGGIDIKTHDVVMRHIRVRPGDAGQPKFSWETDAVSTMGGSSDIIVDHCSLEWAIDENLSASGKRFTGSTPQEWRQGASHRITFSNNIIAEGLRHATHPKGEHSKGSLIHDNATDILIVGNLYAHNYERNPLFKGGVHGMVINNLIYDPGQRAVHYNLIAEEWGEHAYQTGSLALIGNVLREGPSSVSPLALFEIGGAGDIDLYAHDNIAVDRIGNSLPQLGRYTTAPVKINEIRAAPALPEGVHVLAAARVQDAVIDDVGARPWDRDHDDARIIADTIEGRGEIIDSQRDVDGYPKVEETHQAFEPADWDLATMTSKKPPPERRRPH